MAPKRPKTAKPFTLDMAVGRNVLDLPVRHPDGHTLRFRIPEPTDHQRARLLQRLEEASSDEQLIDLLTELLTARSADDTPAADIRAMLTHPDTTKTAISQLLSAVLTGRVPDPKAYGQLMEKLADRMLAHLTQRL